MRRSPFLRCKARISRRRARDTRGDESRHVADPAESAVLDPEAEAEPSRGRRRGLSRALHGASHRRSVSQKWPLMLVLVMVWVSWGAGRRISTSALAWSR